MIDGFYYLTIMMPLATSMKSRWLSLFRNITGLFKSTDRGQAGSPQQTTHPSAVHRLESPQMPQVAESLPHSLPALALELKGPNVPPDTPTQVKNTLSLRQQYWPCQAEWCSN
jgi:hypothetical protein